MDRLASGALARLGLAGEAHERAARALLEKARAEGFKTVRVVFGDSHGRLRGKTIVADALESVLADGMRAPSTLLLKDTANRTVFSIWEAETADNPVSGAADMLLVPDPAAFFPLSWSAGSAWLAATPMRTDGTPLAFCPQAVLSDAVARLSAHGLAMVTGLEVEFHLLRVVEDNREHRHATMPHTPPKTALFTHGYSFLEDDIYDEAEPVLEAIRAACHGAGLPLRSLEVEMGPSQFEAMFGTASPERHALNLTLFRSLVTQVAARHGLHASFMCRMGVANAASSGWHLHQSLTNQASGANVFIPDPDGALSPVASAWIGGLLAHAEATCLMLVPTVNGYKRFQPFQLAPDRIQWGHDNRGAMVRALMAPGDPASRIENRIAEPLANPWLAFAAQILSGLDGIEKAMAAPAPVERPYGSEAQMLPKTMGEALAAFEKSQLLSTVADGAFAAWYATLKRAEWNRYLAHVSDWEQAEYF